MSELILGVDKLTKDVFLSCFLSIIRPKGPLRSTLYIHTSIMLLLDVKLSYYPVCPSLSRSVCWSVSLSVCQKFLTGQEVTLPCSYRSSVAKRTFKITLSVHLYVCMFVNLVEHLILFGALCILIQ